MKKIMIVITVLSVVGCSTPVEKHETSDLINAELLKAADGKSSANQAAVSAALLPPLNIEVPKARPLLEERFNLSFNNVPASQFFMAIVTGTRYSMLVHPDVTGTISANLKNVTVLEALEAIREQYGYDYKIDGTRIYIKPLSLQTSIFKINYLTGSRTGTSDIRVTSGSVSDSGGSNSNAPNTPSTTPATTPSGATSHSLTSSKISTTSTNDFWGELKASLEAIVGNKEGRSVVISPQSGVIVVRGMWEELRNVSAYLKATQLSVDREVILEAKILEVTLSDGFQSGINWAAFRAGANSRVSGGVLGPGSTLQTNGSLTSAVTGLNTALNGGSVTSSPGQNIASTVPGASGLGTLFGLAFQTSNFAALISFLESQGKVHVLSSPRIATVNNQKAVLKVGTDDFFVTSVTTTNTSNGTQTTSSPSVTLQPFFSGVALDVTPQIDEDGNIILHIHPSVSQVSTKSTVVDLGSTNGSLTLPLASSTVSETDSVVRGQDGHIIAIGGLMRQSTTSERSQVPGAGEVPVLGALFRNTNQVTEKRELVILLKPTVIQGDSNWTQDILESQQRIQNYGTKNLSEQK
ncbi:MAG TPA: pilus (MSHA type) biogenesis protein MshL [Burkholderiaceae bacterium]|jgi:MSHA biogenesis protein MshL